MINKLLGSWIIQIFCVLWAIYLFLDYINYSSYFLQSFKYFEYSDLMITIIILVIGIAYLFSNRKKTGVILEIRNFRSIYHYCFTLLLMALVMLFYLLKMGITPRTGPAVIIFIFRTILFHIGLGIILFAALSIGSYLLQLFSLNLDRTSSGFISIAVGFFVITIGLFLLGSLGLLYQFVVIPFILIMIIPGWKNSFALVKQSLFEKSEPFKVHFLAIFAYAIMILLAALTLTFDTRVFPIGYDGLSLYMNVPKLIAGYHGLTQGGDAYNWSLMMSLGFIVFNNPAIAILISVAPGILCLFVIYKICTSLNISTSWSLFACALYYTLPNTIWQSKYDEKTDLALLFITLCSVLLFTGRAISKKVKKESGRLSNLPPDMVIWAICGCLIGFTFGIKYVAMLSIFAFLVVLFYMNAGKYGSMAIFFLNFAIIFGFDLTRFAAFEKDLMFFRFIVPFVLFVIALIFALRDNTKGLILAGKKAIVFCIAAGITFLPWAVKNIAENKKIAFDSMLTGKSPLPALYSLTAKVTGSQDENVPIQTSSNNLLEKKLSGFGFSTLFQNSSKQAGQPNELNKNSRLDRSEKRTSSSTNNEKEEEIRRYIGYEAGIIRFISLPYDLAMKINVRLGSADSGILLLILIPVFILVFSIRQLPWNIIKMITLLFILIISIISVQLLKGSFDVQSSLNSIRENSFSDGSFFRSLFLPVYITLKQALLMSCQFLMPVYRYFTIEPLGLCFVLIVLFTIPFYFLFKSSISDLDLISKTLIVFVFCIVQYWLVLSSGIIWYGIAGFSLVPVVAAILVNKEERSGSKNKFVVRYVVISAAVWFILILPFQFMPNNFLYSKDLSKVNFKDCLDQQFVKYAIGDHDEREVFKHFFAPAQQDMIKILNRDKNSKILNVSTFLNYHIVNNDARVYKDNQLGIFKFLYTISNNDRTKLAGEFRKNNIKYILISLNTAKLDVTPDKSLTRKFDELMIALVNNPEVRLLSTNRIVERPDGDLNMQFNGETVVAKYDVIGKRIIDPGTDALFEIL